jgi:hypothetical protein
VTVALQRADLPPGASCTIALLVDVIISPLPQKAHKTAFTGSLTGHKSLTSTLWKTLWKLQPPVPEELIQRLRHCLATASPISAKSFNLLRLQRHSHLFWTLP